MIEALENPHVSAIAHPTGRMLLQRKPYEIDLDAVMQAARDHGKMLELNAHPSRLDLDDVACAAAKGSGHSDRHFAPTPIGPRASTRCVAACSRPAAAA